MYRTAVPAKAAGFLWTLPNTILGVLLGLLTFQRPRTEGGAILFDRVPRGLSAPPVSTLVFRRFSAFTVGFVIIGKKRVEGRLLAHERHHVRQYCLWGPLYLPVYGLLYLRYGYRRHPFEVAARRAASEVPEEGPTSPGSPGTGPPSGPA